MASGLRGEGKRLVFTSGCFDILHVGHVKHLQKAETFGVVLVVSINSDQSVRRQKVAGVPINDEKHRALTISEFESVDFVVIFDDEMPYDLIRSIRPDVVVKGGDYEGKPVSGQDLVGDMRIVDFEEGQSTRMITNRIKHNEKALK